MTARTRVAVVYGGRSSEHAISCVSAGNSDAVSTAALTVYDMVKAADRGMEIGGIRVILKDGGKSGRYEA